VASAAGAEVSRVGAELTRRNVNIQPTIEIRSGYRFNVRVDRDIVFPASWKA
jgi:type IV secretory pathway VirB10-like protein